MGLALSARQTESRLPEALVWVMERWFRPATPTTMRGAQRRLEEIQREAAAQACSEAADVATRLLAASTRYRNSGRRCELFDVTVAERRLLEALCVGRLSRTRAVRDE